jgi:hypothetical protein
MFFHQNAGQNHNINIGNRYYENMAQLKYLGIAGRNENLINEEMKRRLNSGDTCYHSAQNILSSCQPMVLYGCETWSLALRKNRD